MPSPRKIQIRIRRPGWLEGALQGFYAWYIRLVLRTTRWQYIGFEKAEADIAEGIPRIYCCWHGRLALIPYFREWQDHPMSTFVSMHRDAQLATGLMRQKGLTVIPVQTSGSKTGPVRAAVKALRAGGSLGITPDGPFGPRGVVQPGVVLIAAMAQARMSPVAFSTRFRLTAKSWDRFVIPLPFGSGAFVMDEGFVPPPRPDKEQLAAAQEQLGRLIDAVTAEADRRVARAKK